MLKIIKIAVLGLISITAQAQKGYLIKGFVDREHNGQKVKLSYRNPKDLKQEISDSTIVRNGAFVFSGHVGNLTPAIIEMKPKVEKYEPRYLIERVSRDDQNFFLENENYTITGSNIKKSVIKGGPVQKDYLELKHNLKEADANMWTFTQQMIHYDTTGNVKAKEKLFSESAGSLRKAIEDIELKFRLQHPDSYISLDLIEKTGGSDDPDFERKFNKLTPRIKNSITGKKMMETYIASRGVDVGKISKNFTQNDTNGTPVSLSSFRGKYILLDFWASWCSPCRNQHPYLIEAYKKFKDKGFEIIAVSMDGKRDPWLKAIVDDKISWIQLSDLRGTSNQVAVLYGVTAIPENFLIDPNGVIVARSLHGEEVEKKLSELLVP